LTDTPDTPVNPRDYWKGRSVGWTQTTAQTSPVDDNFAKSLIDAAGIEPGATVLDLAAGTGYPSISIARALDGSGSVTAFDLTPEMLSIAALRAGTLGYDTLRCVSGDMVALPFADNRFDAITCRNGMMFPEDKIACVREAKRVLKPGGRVAFLVWGLIEENPTFLAVNAGLKSYFGKEFPPRMVRHNLGAEGQLTSLLKGAGFIAVKEVRIAYERKVGKGDNYFRGATSRAMPEQTANLTEPEWNDLLFSIEEAAKAMRDGDEFVIPIVARMGIGKAP
jgi:SAM-dependent methyltransferase